MRNMSFTLTTPQMRARTKTVTRRRGWADLKPGDVVLAVEKGMGLRRGEKVRPIRPIQIVSNRRERLADMTDDECVLEGFPALTATQFAQRFGKHMGPVPNRIEFRHLD